MFSQSNWFRRTDSAPGVVPSTWQGWACAGCWLAVLALPGLVLLGQGKVLETVVWLGATGGLLTWDLMQIRRELATGAQPKTGSQPKTGPAKDDDVLVIDENETESARFATRNFDLKFRN
jgi:ribosomal protein S28E/S33